MAETTLTRNGQTARAYDIVSDTNRLPLSTKIVEGSTVFTSEDTGT